ncbi:hypothetical protein F2K62_004098 [Vibrio fluvialis]|nr:hypothetical protein [Vibrio fluvialis]
MASFCSERTVEYMLVPRLVNIFEKYFETVIPLFSYATREFTKLSKNLHSKNNFQVIALFPRRPKISDTGEAGITVFDGLDEFQIITESFGVPVVTGSINASNLWELSKHENFVWFNMRQFLAEAYITPISSIHRNTPEAIYSENALVELAKNSRSVTFNELADIAKQGRMTLGHHLYGPRYRPVYIMLKSH